jgi:hypothetical protein
MHSVCAAAESVCACVSALATHPDKLFITSVHVMCVKVPQHTRNADQALFVAVLYPCTAEYMSIGSCCCWLVALCLE